MRGGSGEMRTNAWWAEFDQIISQKKMVYGWFRHASILDSNISEVSL